MLDKLVEFLLNFIDYLLPIQIIKQYQKGILFRFGIYIKELQPGLHFKIPFFDDIESYPVVTTTLNLPVQSIVTKDGKSVVAKGLVKYKIDNISIFGVQVYDAIDALADISCGVIFDLISKSNYQETREIDLSKILTSLIRKEARKWGINVEKVTLTDYSPMNSLRLFNESVNLIDKTTGNN